jgi:hypothetical protein
MSASVRLLCIATVSLFFNTACVCGSEKNYRLQDIQLSKNFELHTAKFKLQNRGGEYRARTGDLLVANQALSQLS